MDTSKNGHQSEWATYNKCNMSRIKLKPIYIYNQVLLHIFNDQKDPKKNS